MSDFVGDDATENDRELKLGVVTPCEMRHIVVVDVPSISGMIVSVRTKSGVCLRTNS